MLRTRLFSFLKVHWVDVKNTNQSKKKDTYIFSVDLKVFEKLVSLVNQSSFMTALAILVYLYKSHFLQDLIEKHVVDFISS